MSARPFPVAHFDRDGRPVRYELATPRTERRAALHVRTTAEEHAEQERRIYGRPITAEHARPQLTHA